MKSPRDLLVAWLHDPPDKPLAIRGHESRAARYLSAALSDTVTPEEIRGHQGDHRASATERLPVPAWQAANKATVVGPDTMVVHHPLSAERQDDCGIELPRHVNEGSVVNAIEQLVGNIDSTAARFWLLWRFLPEYLEHDCAGFSLLPADTRIPDHSIWQHLDTTAAMHVAYDGKEPPAFLSFSVGPVQSFIASARSVRDLWSGSMILSWLVFQSMIPLLENYGPASVVYPSIRGNPLLDLWLRTDGQLCDAVPPPKKQARKIPCLPNRFLALVPGAEASEMADRVAKSAASAWKSLSSSVHHRLAQILQTLDPQWDRHWARPIEDQFDFRTSVLPWRDASDQVVASLLTGEPAFADAFPAAEHVRELADAIPPEDRPGGYSRVVGQWQYRIELLGRVAEADKSMRTIPRPADVNGAEQVPPMCGLTGATEQVGPATLVDAADFWDGAANRIRVGGVRLRANERLGPTALVKRFSGPVHFVDELEFEDPRELRFDDTATVAAAEWLQVAREDAEFDRLYRTAHDEGTWSGQWLHQVDRPAGEDEPCPHDLAERVRVLRRSIQPGAVPTYYAVLMIDGDELGKWLQGRKSPQVSELIHASLKEYFVDRAGQPAGLEAARPVTPAFHASLSQTLSNFSLHFVPDIVRRHHGTLIYAGGDDVLALLPTATALTCAAELNSTYRSNWAQDGSGRTRMLMGSRATASAGIALVHYKDDLRQALQRARMAEQAAKEQGRDVLQITAARRSGEESTSLCPWSFLPVVQSWAQAFQAGASDRWTYQLRRMLDTMQALPHQAASAMIRRQLARTDAETRTLLGDGNAADVVSSQFAHYVELTRSRLSSADQLRHFVLLCQTASFLARGKDQ